MENKELIKGLKLIAEEKGTAWIASKLGYKTSAAIALWLNKGRIPRAQVQHAQKLVSGSVKQSA